MQTKESWLSTEVSHLNGHLKYFKLAFENIRFQINSSERLYKCRELKYN